MHRYIRPWLLLIVVLAIAGAACQGAGDGPAAEAEGSAPPEEAGDGGQMTIAVWTGPEAEALRAVAPAFTEATGIDVQIDEVDRDSYQTRASTIVLGEQAAWDVFWSDATWMPEFVAAGALEPLDAMLDPAVFDPLGGLEYVTFDDAIYGIPTEYHSQYLYYRADWFDEQGLEVPETWEEYLEVMRATTDASQDRFGGVIRGGGGGGNTSIHFEFSNFFLGFGAQWLDEQGRPAMNSPEGVAALEYFVNLLNTDQVVPPDASAVGFLEKNQYFQTQSAATMIQWTAAYEEIFDCELSPDVCDATELALIPGRDEGGAVERGALASVNGWVVPTGAPNKDAARQFLEWIASEDGAIEWALNGGTPSNTDALTASEVVEQRPDYEILSQTLEFASVPPLVPETSELLGIWSDHLAQALGQQETPQEAMDNIASEWERILTEGGHL